MKKQRQHFADKGPYNQSYGFSNSHVQMWELDHKEDWVPKNWCFQTVVLEKALESPLDYKEIKPVNPEGNQPWIFIGRTEAEVPILWPPDVKLMHWKRPWCWERLRAGGEGGTRGWDGWMALLTQWTWVWVNSRSWWWTGRPGLLQSMGSQRIGHHWATELNWTEYRVRILQNYPSSPVASPRFPATNQVFPRFLLKCDNLLEQLTEIGKMVYLLVYYKGYNSGTAK